MSIPPNTSGKSALFKDHFSKDPDSYSKYRPCYPVELFLYLSSITRGHDLAWDCATGSGQSATHLAKHFHRVIATDASSSQLSKAHQHAAVRYTVATAEDSGIFTSSLDIITVAQALHWFDLPAFSAEVDRTLKHQGILAVWTYNLLNIRADIDEQVNYLYREVLNSYWPAERRLVEQGYESIDFPYPELITPKFNMTLNWNYRQLTAYLSTWSAVKAYSSDKNKNPIDTVRAKLLKHWGNENTELPVTWPLTVRVWKKP